MSDELVDLDSLPYVEAANYGAQRDPASIRWLVVHTPETPETATAAEGVARYFASGATLGSTHLVGDNDSIVRCVPDDHVANGAAGANRYGWHYELAGRARQTAAEWADPYSTAALHLAAAAFAAACRRFDVPAVKIGPSQLVRNERGICGHHDATLAFGKSTHTDPGPYFPWDRFVKLVRRALEHDDEHQEVDEVYRYPLIDVEGDPGPVYLSDGLETRRHLTPASLAAVIASGLVKDGTVYSLPLDEVKALELVGKRYPRTH